MRILLDTHVFLWAITDSPRLSALQQETFQCESNEVYLSVVSIWELLIKTKVGKLVLPEPVVDYVSKQMKQNRITLLPVRIPHLAELESLPLTHRDPFDRMLAAQSLAEKMPMLSVDPLMPEYGVEVI